MVIRLHTTRLHTATAPRWRAVVELNGVRLWTYPVTTPEAASTKAIAMVRAALSHGEVGDFVGLSDGSFRRRRVGEMVIDDV